MADIEKELIARLDPLVSFALATYPDLREKYLRMYFLSELLRVREEERQRAAHIAHNGTDHMIAVPGVQGMPSWCEHQVCFSEPGECGQCIARAILDPNTRT